MRVEADPEVIVREVGMRDGLQSIGVFMATEQKIAWLRAEYSAGIRAMEITSLVPPKLLPQFTDAEAVVEEAKGLAGLVGVVLVPNLRGAQRALDLRVDKIDFVMSASESHNLANVRRSTEESLADFVRIVKLFASAGDQRPAICAGLSTAFGCTIEGAVPESRVRELANRLVGLGADEIVLADTVGYGNPAAIARVFRSVSSDVRPVRLGGHFHDTRGLGLANVLAAYENGASFFDSSLGGFGGCPYAPGATGNIATEDLVYMLESMGLRTGVDLEKLLQVRQQIEKVLPSGIFHGAVAIAGIPRNYPQPAYMPSRNSL